MRSSAFLPVFRPLRFLSFSIVFRCAYWCQNWCQLVPAAKIGANSALRSPREARRPRGPLRLVRRRRISPGTKAASVAPPSASPFVHAARARLAPHRAACWYLGYAPAVRSALPSAMNAAPCALRASTGHFRPSQRLARGMVGPWYGLAGIRRNWEAFAGRIRPRHFGDGAFHFRRGRSTASASMRPSALPASPVPPPCARPVRPPPLPASALEASPPVVHAACASARRSSRGKCKRGISWESGPPSASMCDRNARKWRVLLRQ